MVSANNESKNDVSACKEEAGVPVDCLGVDVAVMAAVAGFDIVFFMTPGMGVPEEEGVTPPA